MVKSKKMSKSSIAIIVLALLLILSMVLGLTGAWFTDKAEQAAAGSQTLGFGKVDINATGVASYSYAIAQGNTEYLKLVDGDCFTVTDELTIENVSTVNILYVAIKTFTVTATGDLVDVEDDANTTEVNEHFHLGDYIYYVDGLNVTHKLETLPAQVVKGRLAYANSTAAQFNLAGNNGAGEYYVESEGALNGKTGTFTISADVDVYAVQAGNISTLAQLKEAFTAAGLPAAQVNALALSDFS